MVERDFSSGRQESFFHVCTDGNSLPWMFKDDQDFIQGTNRVGICSFLTGVEIVSFVLMDNHIHLLLRGTMLQCKDFINKYKQLTGKYIFFRYSVKEHLKGLESSVIPIEDEDNLLAVMAYIDRNPVVAGYRNLPTEYPWGTARYIFKETCFDTMDLQAKKLADIPCRTRRAVLNTRIGLPGEWLINDEGMILPISFWKPQLVESIFKTSARYLYFLSKKLEGDIDATITKWNNTFIPDKDLRPVVEQLSQSIGGTKDVRLLTISARLSLARKLRYEYASTIKQISRMLHLNVDHLKGYV